MKKLSFLVIALGIALHSGAKANEPRVKSTVTVKGEIVRLGDLIEHAGTKADAPIFRAPDPGTTGSIPLAKVMDAAYRNGLNPTYEKTGEVSITRSGRLLSEEEVRSALAGFVISSYGLRSKQEDIRINLDRELEAIKVSLQPVETSIVAMRWDRASNRFEAQIRPDRGLNPIIVRGTMLETREVVVPNRNLARGDIVSPDDFRLARLDRRELSELAIEDPRRIVGLSAKRSLASGRSITDADFMKPEHVERNSAVLIVFEMQGITLTAKGKALSSGTMGDVINVTNLQTKRMLQGTVTGPNQVSVSFANLKLSNQRAALER